MQTNQKALLLGTVIGLFGLTSAALAHTPALYLDSTIADEVTATDAADLIKTTPFAQLQDAGQTPIIFTPVDSIVQQFATRLGGGFNETKKVVFIGAPKDKIHEFSDNGLDTIDSGLARDMAMTYYGGVLQGVDAKVGQMLQDYAYIGYIVDIDQVPAKSTIMSLPSKNVTLVDLSNMIGDGALQGDDSKIAATARPTEVETVQASEA